MNDAHDFTWCLAKSENRIFEEAITPLRTAPQLTEKLCKRTKVWFRFWKNKTF